MDNAFVHSVSGLNGAVKSFLGLHFGQVWLVGEVSNLSQPVSGHWYFSLKDAQAQVRCAMFRGNNASVHFRVQNGVQILVRAKVTIYEPRGDYQLIVEEMRPAGLGALQQQFDALKLALQQRGWFDAKFKRALPKHCQRVGVITSSTGAALQDILHILRRRDPSLQVVIYPTAVQGKAATANIVEMINLANERQEVDALIVGRGGGSLEDLWCFNEEAVAEAIFSSTIPIISAVGHETDITIADFVADVRAPTPSAAAELISRDQQELRLSLQGMLDRLGMALDRTLGAKLYRLQQGEMRLLQCHPQKQFSQAQQRLQALEYALTQQIQRKYSGVQLRLQQVRMRLLQAHPKQQITSQQAQFSQLALRLQVAITKQFDQDSRRYQNLQQRLQDNPLPLQVHQYQQHCTNLLEKIQRSAMDQVQFQGNKFSLLCHKLHDLSPLVVLSRGYAIATQDDHPITQSRSLKKGDEVRVRLHEGEFFAEVKQILP